MQGETFFKKFPPAFFLILFYNLLHFGQKSFNFANELELGASAVEVVVRAVDVVIEVTVDVVGQEARCLLKGDDERGIRQQLAFSLCHTVAKLLKECGGECLKLCKVELYLVEVDLILGARRCTRAHGIAKIVKERAGHNGVKVDNANSLARGGIEEHVVELGVVVCYAERNGAVGNAVNNQRCILLELAAECDFGFNRCNATCAVGGNGFFKLCKTVGRIVKTLDRFGKTVCGELRQHLLKTAECVCNLGKILGTLGNLKAYRVLYKVAGAPVVALGSFVVRQALLGGQKGHGFSCRVSAGRGDLFAQIGGHRHDVAHYLGRVFKNACVDALQNNAGIAIY